MYHPTRRGTIMQYMPAAIDQATRTAVTARITAHVTRGWPHLETPIMRFRGQFCYVDAVPRRSRINAVLRRSPQPSPILRLRYQGSIDRWDIGIYLASDQRYTESELPTSFGPRTGTPEEGIDHTFILYAGPSTHQ
jgi:hypothetical protein